MIAYFFVIAMAIPVFGGHVEIRMKLSDEGSCLKMRAAAVRYISDFGARIKYISECEPEEKLDTGSTDSK